MVHVGGPFFEDFTIGDDFSDVPSVTLTEGHAAVHQALTGDRLKLCLDRPLSEQVTGQHRMLANPSLVCNLAIGQSTIPSQRVLGNLFYRGLYFQAPVFIGDTLTTSTKVVALRQNQKREGRAASGMVVLEMEVKNQSEDTLLHFFRCPMIPCRDPEAETGHTDSFDDIPDGLADDLLIAGIPDWHFEALNRGLQRDALPLKYLVEARDTVTLAPELVRMTLNLAMTHTDVQRSVYDRRLVYGGHTISIAAAQLSRAMPDLLTIMAWYHCSHTAPVFEGDILRSVVQVNRLIDAGTSQLADIQVDVFASRDPASGSSEEEVRVLDWRLAGLLP